MRKMLMGLHFIFNGAAAGQLGIIATLQENTTQLERIVNGFGWSLASESVELMYRSPVDLYLDERVYELVDVIEPTHARRVFIDSLGDLRRAAVDELRFREYLYSPLQRCANPTAQRHDEPRNTSAIRHLPPLRQRHPAPVRTPRRPTTACSDRTQTRASRHDHDIREFNITPQGIVLDELHNNTTP
jgi:circadian clock protein KaiC